MLLILDISLAYPLLSGAKYSDYDYLVSDLSYSAGIDTAKGAVVLSDVQEKGTKIKAMLDGIGSILQPMDCFLNMRGYKTLSVRINEQLKNRTTII